MTRIYLDHAATARVRPEAAAAMAALAAAGGNAGSLHAEGRAARSALDSARATAARILGAAPREIVFTASGSEADTLAIVGAGRARGRPGHLITSAIEHQAVLRAAEVLECEGWRVTRLPVTPDGLIDPQLFAEALAPDTALASIGLANNEIGVVQPIAQLAQLARAAGVVMHTDAVQAAGWLSLQPDALGVDLLTLSGHKVGAPAGAGLLYVRRGVALAPLVVGGGQEHGLRAGTENVPAIAAFSAALALADGERALQAPRVRALRDRLQSGILAAIPDVAVNGGGAERLPNLVSLAFGDLPGDALLIRLDLEGIAASAGSACAAGSLEPSHVARALGLDERRRSGVIRFSLGQTTTSAEIEAVLALLPRLVADVRRPAAVI